jgi:hypothetical protein
MRTFRIIALCLVMVALALPLAAQRKSSSKKKKSKDEDEKPLTERIWYGCGLGIGGGGVGLSPMVGYNFWGPFSIGPRGSVFFSSQKVIGQKALNFWDTEAGGFLRIRAYRGLFLQGELANAWYQVPAVDPNTGLFTKETLTRNNQYVGLGYNFGDGGFGSEISIFYNFGIANDINTNESPLQYRFAFTYRF